MRTPIVASAAAIICIAAGCNRSSPLTSDAVDRSLPTSGAGDPALTVELVSKDVATHKGKRVRWFGHQMSFESTSGGGEQKTMYTYADVAAWQSGGSLHPFVVQMSSQKGEPGKMPSLGDAPMDAWVTGTVAGTHTIGLTRGSPSGSESTSPEIVPLLVYAQFEAKGATK